MDAIDFINSMKYHLGHNAKEVKESDLILSIFGVYPDREFHLFQQLNRDCRNYRFDLNTVCFPAQSYKLFFDTYLMERSKMDIRTNQPKPISFPPSVHALYSQFLISSVKERGVMSATPFEYYLIHFLFFIWKLQINPISCVQKTSEGTVEYSPAVVQLFLHYMHYLVDPENPSKPSILDSHRGSVASSLRPDCFFLSAIAEMWLCRDATIPNDLELFLHDCNTFSVLVGVIQKMWCN